MSRDLSWPLLRSSFLLFSISWRQWCGRVPQMLLLHPNRLVTSMKSLLFCSSPPLLKSLRRGRPLWGISASIRCESSQSNDLHDGVVSTASSIPLADGTCTSSVNSDGMSSQAIAPSAIPIELRSSSEPASDTSKREKTYGQKIRAAFYENERRRLPAILKQVEQILAEPEKEPYGEFRGLDIFRERSMHRGATVRSAKKKFSALIGKRHAMRHGHHKLRHMMNCHQLAPSIFGRNTDIFINVQQARIILNQFWCYGRSRVYEHLKHEEELRRQKRREMQKNGLAPPVRTWINTKELELEDFSRELKRKLNRDLESVESTNAPSSSYGTS